jgi:hypothetical protein
MKGRLRYRSIVLGITIAALLLCLTMAPRRVAPSKGIGLQVTFLGLTNNPVAQFKPFRLCVSGSPSGTCALFRLKNAGGLRCIGFETSGVEQLTTEGWRPFSPTGPWQGMKGAVWPPGSSALFAIGWPPGLSSNTTWRLALRWREELTIPAEVINQWSNRKIFHYDEDMNFSGYSSPVAATAPNQRVQATPGSALGEFKAFLPGAPDPDRSAFLQR